MSKRLHVLLTTSLVVTATCWTGSAVAIAPFKAEFEAMYVKKESSDAKHKALVDAVAGAKCNICHKGTSKKDLNAYGMALSELLDKKSDAQDKEKIRAALTKVSNLKSDPANASSPTFGDLIEQGKLPAQP